MTKKNQVNKLLIDLCLVLLSSFLFALSHPNLIFKNGLSFIAFFAYIPILVLIRKNTILPCIGWGAIYGYVSYALFNYWLGTFHPMAGVIAYSLYLIYLAAVFFLLKIADIFYPKKGYLVQWIIFLAYEYLRTKGFLGYSYGITGYSQWNFIPLIQIASITGVWGVSALVTFPSFWLAELIRRREEFTTNLTNNTNHTNGFKKEEFTTNNTNSTNHTKNLYFLKIRSWSSCGSWLKIPIIIWTAAFTGALVFGFVSIKNFDAKQYPTAVIALIQHNTDPWLASQAPTSWQRLEAYRKDLAILTRLSDEAIAADPKPAMVVWPETAFVPRIYWHTTYRSDQDSWIIVRELLEYLSKAPVPFLIGNDDARREPAKNPNQNENFRVDYNAALLFEDGNITGSYRKLHLVPFTEHFPYKKQFPFIYKALKDSDTHFWEKGEDAAVFQGPGFTFSAPICFEDTFGYLSRNFVRGGADVLVNLSNDAWADSLPSQMQHLSMAVFRAVENHRPMVRSTASGQTCAIDPLGRVIHEAAPFTESWINAIIPLAKKDTIYTLYGDYLAVFFLFAALILLIFGAIWYRIRP